jgi:hypothetical protein
MAAIKALVKPELLRWARNRAKVKPEDAAKAAHVTVERLQAWEHGGGGTDTRPASRRLRCRSQPRVFPALQDEWLSVVIFLEGRGGR